jgi:hypothetical protein
VLGGSLARVTCADNAILSMTGGTVTELRANDLSTVFLYGTSFAVDGISVPSGPLTALSGTLTGNLANGDALDTAFLQGGGANTGTIVVTYVPEPGAVPLVAAGALGLALLHASRRRRPSEARPGEPIFPLSRRWRGRSAAAA